jgi:hypothetical protein
VIVVPQTFAIRIEHVHEDAVLAVDLGALRDVEPIGKSHRTSDRHPIPAHGSGNRGDRRRFVPLPPARRQDGNS